MRLIRLFKNDIARESVSWVEEELITLSQAEEICKRYDVDYHQAGNRTSGYNVLVGLGYLFIGLAVITLLASNWDEIPRALRMWVLILITMATHGYAIKKTLAGDSGGAAGVFFLGNLFYGASIILIAQIYHLGEHMPAGIFWWATGCMIIAVLINSSWVALQGALLSLVWFLLEVNLSLVPLLFFPLFLLGSFSVLYHGKPSILLFLTLVLSVLFWTQFVLAEFWSDGRYLEFHVEHLATGVSMLILAFTLGEWLAQKESASAKDYGTVLGLWSLRIGIIFMLVMSFEEPWTELLTASWEHQFSMLVLVDILSLISLALAYKINRLSPIIYVAGFYLLSISMVLLSNNPDHGLYFQIVYNLALVCIGIWLILKGIDDGVLHYFFLGVASLLLTALMRYIDLIGNYMGGAALFLVSACVLLGAARYRKNIDQGRPEEAE